MARWIILPDPLISRVKEFNSENTDGKRISESFTKAAKAISKMGDAIAETAGQTISRALISIDKKTAKRLIRHLESLQKIIMHSPFAKILGEIDDYQSKVLPDDIESLKREL